MRHLIALVLFGITSACTQEAVPAVPVRDELMPSSAFDLKRDAGRTLDPQKLTAVDDSTWFAADLATREVWKFSLTASRIFASRVWRSGDSDTVRPLAFAATKSEIGILTKGVGLFILDAGSFELKRRLLVSANRARLLGLYPADDGAWLLVEQRIVRRDKVSRDSLFVRRIDSTSRSAALWSAEKSRASNVVDLLADAATSTGRASTVIIGLASPPRLLELRVDSSRVRDALLPLSNAPHRRVSSADLARAREMTSRSGEMMHDQVPAQLPPVTRVWPVPHGYIVLAPTSFDDFAVDLYCGKTFLRTVMTEVADAVVLPTVLIARIKRLDRGIDRFEAYPLDHLPVSCV